MPLTIRLHATGKRAFTLIELLVVIAIVSLLIAMLLPALQKANFSAKRIACASNERQMLLGMTMYTTDSDGYIARRDHGRGDGSWAGHQGAIANDRPVGATPGHHVMGPSPFNYSIFNHGSWLISAYIPVADPLYCPGVSYQTEGERTTTQWRDLVNAALPLFQSGGMSGQKVGTTLSLTSYNFHGVLLAPGFARSGDRSPYWKGAGHTAGWRVSEMEGWFPIFTDVRGIMYNQVRFANHESQGFNVARADGAVRWLTADEVIQGGTQVGWYTARVTFQNQYATVPLPAVPIDSHVSGGNWFLSGSKALDIPFEAIGYAMQ